MDVCKRKTRTKQGGWSSRPPADEVGVMATKDINQTKNVRNAAKIIGLVGWRWTRLVVVGGEKKYLTQRHGGNISRKVAKTPRREEEGEKIIFARRRSGAAGYFLGGWNRFEPVRATKNGKLTETFHRGTRSRPKAVRRVVVLGHLPTKSALSRRKI